MGKGKKFIARQFFSERGDGVVFFAIPPCLLFIMNNENSWGKANAANRIQ